MARYNLIHTKYRQTAFRSPAEGTPLSPYQRSFGTTYLVPKYSRVLILSWEKEYLQAQLPLNTASHFLIRDLVGHLLEFIKISLAHPMLFQLSIRTLEYLPCTYVVCESPQPACYSPYSKKAAKTFVSDKQPALNERTVESWSQKHFFFAMAISFYSIRYKLYPRIHTSILCHPVSRLRL